MPNTYFQFKQFRIEQDKCAMKVGTDGVLLGAWANPGSAKRILDVGTGTGLIAIMLAQRSNAIIDAVEIENVAYLQALENGRSSPWSDRLSFFNDSFEKFIEKAGNKYDLIISNPPYHTEAINSPNSGRRLARQAESLHFSLIINSASALLTAKGRISFILPVSEEIKAQKLATDCSLICTRLTHIIPCPGKESSRSLMEFSYELQPLRENTIIIEEAGRHQYSIDYMQLTKDFYLNF
jgi:tRNA1Val (adenine37-N6)-methyltransferase